MTHRGVLEPAGFPLRLPAMPRQFWGKGAWSRVGTAPAFRGPLNHSADRERVVMAVRHCHGPPPLTWLTLSPSSPAPYPPSHRVWAKPCRALRSNAQEFGAGLVRGGLGVFATLLALGTGPECRWLVTRSGEGPVYTRGWVRVWTPAQLCTMASVHPWPDLPLQCTSALAPA